MVCAALFIGTEITGPQPVQNIKATLPRTRQPFLNFNRFFLIAIPSSPTIGHPNNSAEVAVAAGLKEAFTTCFFPFPDNETEEGDKLQLFEET